MRLAVQEQLLPGDTMQARWETALTWGFDAIELRGAGGHALRARLPELRAALVAAPAATATAAVAGTAGSEQDGHPDRRRDLNPPLPRAHQLSSESPATLPGSGQ